MSHDTNEPKIREAFESCLIEGLKGQPLTTKDGPVLDPETNKVVLVAPEASFLSVVRAYLKDLIGSKDDKPGIPKTGQPRPGGELDRFAAKTRGLPFGTRPS